MTNRFDRSFNPWAAFCAPGAVGFGAAFGPRGRIFDRGDLKYVILELLAERPMHGYEVMRALEEKACGYYSPSPGSVYPTLQLLEDEGYVRCEENEGRKTYTITDEGRAFLDRNRERVDDILARLARFAREFSGSSMAGITRSFVKLAQASFESAVRQAGDPQVLDRLRRILEQAAREVEEAGAETRDAPI